MINLLQKIQKSLINNKYNLKVGDFIEVKLYILDSDKKKIQSFLGIIISIKNKGISSSFTVRKIKNNEGIEKIIFFNSTLIYDIIIKYHYKVRKAKLYFLRNNYKIINKLKK